MYGMGSGASGLLKRGVKVTFSKLFFHMLDYYSRKNAGLFQPKFGSNMDKPKCGVKNVI